MGEPHFVLLLPTIANILNKGMARLLSELTHFMPEHGEAIADSTNRCHTEFCVTVNYRKASKLGLAWF